MAAPAYPPQHRRVRLLDGGMGDEIHKRLGTNELEWSAPGILKEENHQLVKQLHREFVQAGAHLITTCNFSVRKQNGFNEEQIRFAGFYAGKIAREVSNEFPERKIVVLGSLPPLLECFRNDTRLAPETDYIPLIETLASNCDILIGETLSSTNEATQVLDTTAKVCPRVPCWLSFSVTQSGTLYSGEKASDAVIKLLSSDDHLHPSAILFNCSSPEAIRIALENIKVSSHCQTLFEKTGCELGAYPNRYLPVSQDWSSLAQAPRLEVTPEKLSQVAKDFVSNFGVTLIGGCCGITAEYIAALRSALCG